MIPRRIFGTVTLLFASLFATGEAYAQFQCAANPVTATTIRAEGNTELLPSFSFTCISGVSLTGTANLLFQIGPDVPITSKVMNVATGATEITATVGSQTTQGTVSNNVAVFSNLILSGTSVTVTVTNVRVNASVLTSSVVPSAVTMQGFFEGITNLMSGGTSVQTVAYASPSLGSPAGSSTAYSGCFNINGGTAPSFLVPISENFAGAFRTQADEASTTAVTVNGVNNQVSSGTRFRIVFTNVSGGGRCLPIFPERLPPLAWP